MNERYLAWDKSAQRQLIRLHAADQLGLSQEELAIRLEELRILLPDMVGKLENMKATIVVQLLRDTNRVASTLMELRDALPALNVSSLVARYPLLLTELEPEQVEAQLAHLQEHLQGVDVQKLVDLEPAVLRVNVQQVLAEITRIMPAGTDPVQVLVSKPSMVLDMQQLGLSSTASELEQ